MIWVMAALPLLLLVMGQPVFIVLLASAACALLWMLPIPPVAAHQILFGSLDTFALLAVPFFIFAGGIMGQGGLSKRLVNWVLAFVGNLRGSLALTSVGTCTVFGAVSGSSPATVAAIGGVLYQPLREAGYPRGFSGGLLASSGAIASIIPPSIAMILYGYAADQSVSDLFIAGIVPGILLGLALTLYIALQAMRWHLEEGGRFAWAVVWRTTIDGMWALGMPAIVLGGIYGGVFSPTEAAGIACAYAIFVTMGVYRELNWKGLWQVAIQSTQLTAQIMVIVAAAGLFSYILTVQGVPQSLTRTIGGLELSPWVLLLLLNVVLVMVGCLLDPASAILVLTPLLLPLITAAGIDPIHFGIIMTVNLSIGMFTPPFGLNLFISQALFDIDLIELYRGVLPFIVISLAVLGLITYLPLLSLALLR